MASRATIVPIGPSGPWIRELGADGLPHTMSVGAIIRTVNAQAGGYARLVERGTMWQICAHDGAPVEWYTVSQVRQVVVEEV